MDRVEIGAIGLIVTLVLIGLRVPIGVTLGSVAFVGIWVITSLDVAWGILSAIPYSFIANWSFSAIPMFLLMGFLASEAGLTRGLFQLLRLLLANVPGGLASATVSASALFSAASGSSVATAAAMSRVSIPEMLKSGYDKGLASGAVAVSGTLGSLIPPSILMVIYGIFTQTSISKLFMGGVIPGIITALTFVALITMRVWLKPSLAPRVSIHRDWPSILAALRDCWPLPVLIVSVMTGIFVGIFTPTEAGAVGASLALAIALIRRELSWTGFLRAGWSTAVGTTILFVVAIGASLFTRFLGFSQLPTFVTEHVLAISTSPLFVVLFALALYLVLGAFIESIGVMLLTLPVLIPLLVAADIDLVWFGILVIKFLEIGLVTPPVGLNAYVVQASLPEHLRLSDVFGGIWWFLLAELFVVSLLISFPSLTLWLPSLM